MNLAYELETLNYWVNRKSYASVGKDIINHDDAKCVENGLVSLGVCCVTERLTVQ
ncbi:uncharacterized protein LOC143240307 isoform X4 [Tachypleus tridentatus]|uniref:uncharacterized protein LOC143240307 isoform X4 n=1 Tax=Tachypleus tridentatus TaxID=6853 RepID=UPI003FD1E2C3